MIVKGAAKVIEREDMPVLNHDAAVSSGIHVEVRFPIKWIRGGGPKERVKVGQHERLLIGISRCQRARGELPVGIGRDRRQLPMPWMPVGVVSRSAIRAARPERKCIRTEELSADWERTAVAIPIDRAV